MENDLFKEAMDKLKVSSNNVILKIKQNAIKNL